MIASLPFTHSYIKESTIVQETQRNRSAKMRNKFGSPDSKNIPSQMKQRIKTYHKIRHFSNLSTGQIKMS